MFSNYDRMKTLLILVLCSLTVLPGFTQTNPTMPDVNKMMKMSPAELDAGKTNCTASEF
jgi:hypothetical protein